MNKYLTILQSIFYIQPNFLIVLDSKDFAIMSKRHRNNFPTTRLAFHYAHLSPINFRANNKRLCFFAFASPTIHPKSACRSSCAILELRKSAITNDRLWFEPASTSHARQPSLTFSPKWAAGWSLSSPSEAICFAKVAWRYPCRRSSGLTRSRSRNPTSLSCQFWRHQVTTPSPKTWDNLLKS